MNKPIQLKGNQLIIACTIACFGIVSKVNAQTNVLPETGNVGIGTTDPTSKLQVSGSARIDSTLTVKDSIVVEGNADLYGNLTVHDGDLRLTQLTDSSAGFLVVDSIGKVKRGDDETLKRLIYGLEEMEPQLNECPVDMLGNVIYFAPYWQADAQRMFILNSTCLPDVKLGIGTKPTAKLHIKTSNGYNTHPIVVEKQVSGGIYKLMELDNTGLLYAREVKVNLDSWPDYVFEEGYQLMPLEELNTYIEENHHLPDVPAACEMEEQGINVAENNVMLMEKIEELTLYLLQVQQQVKDQEALLSQQAELLKQQQETLRLQQLLLEQLQQTTTKP